MPRRKQQGKPKRDWQTPDELGAELGYTGRMVRKWCEQGLIRTALKSPGGSWRIYGSDKALRKAIEESERTSLQPNGAAA